MSASSSKENITTNKASEAEECKKKKAKAGGKNKAMEDAKQATERTSLGTKVVVIKNVAAAKKAAIRMTPHRKGHSAVLEGGDYEDE